MVRVSLRGGVGALLVACGAGMSCGECKFCRQGRTHLCTTYATIGSHQDGALAEHVIAPASICLCAIIGILWVFECGR